MPYSCFTVCSMIDMPPTQWVEICNHALPKRSFSRGPQSCTRLQIFVIFQDFKISEHLKILDIQNNSITSYVVYGNTWNSFSSSLQTCGDAGRSICDIANAEAYRKYTKFYNNVQRFQISKAEISTRFQRGLYEISRELQTP